MLGGIDFSILLCAYAMGFWLPTFIKQAGVADIGQIGVLTALPSIAALAGMVLLGASSDRLRERRWHIIVPFWLGATAMAASTLFTHNIVMTVLLFSVAQAAIIGTVPVFFSLRPFSPVPPRPPALRWLVHWLISPVWSAIQLWVLRWS
jgi:sugar phosphate permease